MLIRWIALICVLLMLPTVELVEQGAHAVEHVITVEAADHGAHHDDHDAGDEHGCTQLVHVCGGHQGCGVTPATPLAIIARFQIAAIAVAAPIALTDLATREPAYRPPIV